MSEATLQTRTAEPSDFLPDRHATLILRILRVGVAMCFIGHGAFGIITKEAWLPYFAVASIPDAWAWRLMPLVGTMDIAIGIFALIWPTRALFLWAAIWTAWTALLRPLAGQGWSEFFERAGNYGVALGVLAIVGVGSPWLARLPEEWPAFTERVRRRLGWTLRIATASLLAGHAGLAIYLQKPALADHYAQFFPANAQDIMLAVGYFEIVLACLVLTISVPFLLCFVAGWKLATESLFLFSGAPAPMFEVIERGGSYLVPIALAVLVWSTRQQQVPASHKGSGVPTSPSRPIDSPARWRLDHARKA